MTTRRSVVAGLVSAAALATALPLAGVAPASATATRLPVNQLRIMNYYPADAGWTGMWSSYSHDRTAADFRAIASLGANTVRLIVQPAAVGYPIVRPAAASAFADAVRTASDAGLSVQLTLFDWWSSYRDVTGSRRWLQSLLDPQRGNPSIALVELQNELPLGNVNALSWAKSMLPFLRVVLPGVPRTLSAAGTTGVAGIRRLLATFGPTLVDVADVHFYGDAANAAASIEAAKAAAGGRPVIVGEAGMSTADGPAGEIAQARFFGVVAQTTKALGVPAAAPWVLSDFTATGIPYQTATAQYHYGLRRVDGSWKPAAAVVRAAFRGTATGNLDGGFEQEDSSGATRFGAWTPYAATLGRAFVGHTLVRTGTSSMCFTGTTSTLAAVPSVEQALPVLSAGRRITATGYVDRLAGTGDERIALGWFDADGHYLGQTESTRATGDSAWQQLRVSALAPAGAAVVQVHLKAGDETGLACYDDVAVSW